MVVHSGSTLETSRDRVSKVNSIIPVDGEGFVQDNDFNVTFLSFRLLLQLKKKKSFIPTKETCD